MCIVNRFMLSPRSSRPPILYVLFAIYFITTSTSHSATYSHRWNRISGQLHPTAVYHFRTISLSHWITSHAYWVITNWFFSSIRIPANHSHTLLCSYSRKIRHKKRILDGIIECLWARQGKARHPYVTTTTPSSQMKITYKI